MLKKHLYSLELEIWESPMPLGHLNCRTQLPALDMLMATRRGKIKFLTESGEEDDREWSEEETETLNNKHSPRDKGR